MNQNLNAKEKKGFEREQKIAHRIKLKKRLEKAKQKYSATSDTNNIVNNNNNDKEVDLKNPKKHELTKPDPPRRPFKRLSRCSWRRSRPSLSGS